MQYYDKSSENYYYYHRETNATQWEKPVLNEGVVLLGIAYGTGRDYIIEEGGTIERSDGKNTDVASDDEIFFSTQPEDDPNFDDKEVLDRFDSYWRWNHPYRIPERTDVSSNSYWRHRMMYVDVIFSLDITHLDMLYFRPGAESMRPSSGEFLSPEPRP